MFPKAVLRKISSNQRGFGIQMHAVEVDKPVAAHVRELMQANQRQLLQEMNSLMQKMRVKKGSSIEEQLLKISSIVATGEMPKCKRKRHQEQLKVNTKVILKLDEAEKSNTETTKEKIVEAKDLLNTDKKWFNWLINLSTDGNGRWIRDEPHRQR